MSAAPDVISPQDGLESNKCYERGSFLGLKNGQVTSTPRITSDVSSSGDEFNTKIRKPYTLTKQRERWTEEEHQKFIEALKLYGRSWRQIEEHIGTKTAVQIRSHAQKFFSKVEREALSGGSDSKVHNLKIPPPRPKRKPSHPYPRKARKSSPPSMEKEKLLPKNQNFFSTSRSLPANVESQTSNRYSLLKGQENEAMSAATKMRGYATDIESNRYSSSFLQDNGDTQPPNLNSFSSGYFLQPNSTFPACIGDGKFAQGRKPFQDASFAQFIHGAQRGMSSAPTRSVVVNDSMEGSNFCEEGTVHLQPVRTQMCVNEGMDDSNIEVSSTEDEPVTTSHAFSRQKRTSYESEGHVESPSGINQEIPGQASVNNPMDMWMKHFLDCYNKVPNSQDFVPSAYGHLFGNPLCSPVGWQLLHASMMNHPAAFAAAMAATKWTMSGSGLSAPFIADHQNHLPQFPGDQNAAFLAAASASWWMFGGMFPPIPGFQQHPAMTATFSHINGPGVTRENRDKPDASEPIHSEDNAPENPNMEVHKEKHGIGSDSSKPKIPETNPTNDDVLVSNRKETQMSGCVSGDEFDGHGKPREGSSSGSNTPTLRSPSSGAETPTPPGTDVKEDIPCELEDTQKNTCGQETETINVIEGSKLKCKVMEKGKYQSRDIRQLDTEHGKRLKGYAYDLDSRKEVSQEGRKAFQALFTCKILPQTFDKAVTFIQQAKDNSTSEIPSDYTQMDRTSLQQSKGRNADLNSVLADADVHRSRHDNVTANSGSQRRSSTVPCSTKHDDKVLLGKSTSLSISSRASRSGFVPYQKPLADSDIGSHNK